MGYLATLFATVCLTTFAFVAADGVPKLPNIGFLGRGYDILRANPRPLREPLDTGFVSSVFDMTSYVQGRQTVDGRHLVPDYTDVVECTACQLAYQASVISGASSYKKSPSKQIEKVAKFDLFGFKFGHRASEAYMRTVEQTTTYKNVLVDVAASCLVYCAELRLPLKPTNLDAAFVEAVRLLPANTSDSMLFKYVAFLRQFGTHFVTGMRSGSLFWQRFSFSNDNFSKVEKETSNVGTETAAGLAFISSTFNYQRPQETDTGEKFSKLASSMTFHAIGAPPPTWQGLYTLQHDSEMVGGVDKITDAHRISVNALTAVLSSQFFPDDVDIDLKRSNLETIVQDGGYCSYLASVTVGSEGFVNCAEEQADNIQKDQVAKSNFGGTYYMAGYVGIEDVANQLNGA